MSCVCLVTCLPGTWLPEGLGCTSCAPSTPKLTACTWPYGCLLLALTCMLLQNDRIRLAALEILVTLYASLSIGCAAHSARRLRARG